MLNVAGNISLPSDPFQKYLVKSKGVGHFRCGICTLFYLSAIWAEIIDLR